MNKSVYFLLLIFFLSLFSNVTINAEENKEVLISPLKLSGMLEDPNLVILHIGRPDEYDEEHIPGSVLVSMRELIVEREGISHELPDADFVEKTFRKYGINNNSTVVVSYDSDMMLTIAARLYLILDYYGLGESAYFLNGGLPQWKEEGLPLSDEKVEIKEGNYFLSLNKNVLIDSEVILKNLENPGFRLVDARPEDAYEGREEESHFARQGHIKGAVNIPFFEMVYEDEPYLFLNDDELKAKFSDLFIDDNSRIVTYCGTGIWACAVYVAARHLGYDVKFYDGSFQEWSLNENLPIVTPVDVGMEE